MKTISKVIQSPLDLIGKTPLMKLEHIDMKSNCMSSGGVWAKLEFLNPSGSVKDRIALRMIEDAEKSGLLTKQKTIIEASSGNTALALSFVGGVKGYRRLIFCPHGVSKEKIDQIERYGAEVEIMHDKESFEGISMHGAYAEIPGRIKCKQMEETSDNIWWARQFSNPSNYYAHEELAEEIIEQIAGSIDGFVASVGTGGTLFGIAKALKRHNPALEVWAIEPQNAKYMSLTNLEIIPGVSGGIFSEILESGIVDRFVKLEDQKAIEMHYRLVREKGLFTGVSAGANVYVALELYKKLGEEANVVTVLPDSANRYLTSVHYTT